ncbi:MAG: prenyltransferase [Anaerolineae bacterium]|nr:prenyltransferase [Anaerolineae bacterium]MDK1118955.1 prenyltransferase [Anaerolineae bacterium]
MLFLIGKKLWLISQVLIKMARPPQILAIFLVSVLGSLVGVASGSELSLKGSSIGFLALILISISIHFANEYADYETDERTRRTLFSGGSGALPKSGLDREFALVSAWVALIIGAGLATYGLFNNLIPPISIAILSLGAFFGWMYSLQPMALAWKGWGELTNSTLGGILLPLFAFSMHTRTISLEAFLAFTPFGMLVFNNLLATQWTDRKADASVGKLSLANLWPVKRLRLLHAFVATGAILLSVILTENVLPPFVVLAGLITVPLLIWSVLAYTHSISAFASVAAMALFLLAQISAWLTIVYDIQILGSV